MDQQEETLPSVIGVQMVAAEETHRYSITDSLELDERRYQLKAFVEKPEQGTVLAI